MGQQQVCKHLIASPPPNEFDSGIAKLAAIARSGHDQKNPVQGLWSSQYGPVGTRSASASVRDLALVIAPTNQARCLPIVRFFVSLFAGPASLGLLLLSIAGHPAPLGDTPSPNRHGQNSSLLFVVSMGQAKAYLFGTIHVGREEMYPFSETVLHAFESSRFIAVESDTRNQARARRIFEERAFYPNSTDLQKNIPPEVMANALGLIHKYRIPETLALRCKPRTLATYLTIADAAFAGYVPDWGAEKVIFGLAEMQRKRVVSLELEGAALDLEYGLTPQEQVQLLEHDISAISTGREQRKVKAFIDAWQRGDAAELAGQTRRAFMSLPEPLQTHELAILAIRNADMTAQIENLLRSPIPFSLRSASSTWFRIMGSFICFDSTGIVWKSSHHDGGRASLVDRRIHLSAA